MIRNSNTCRIPIEITAVLLVYLHCACENIEYCYFNEFSLKYAQANIFEIITILPNCPSKCQETEGWPLACIVQCNQPRF